jgi:hypothetical protein
LTPFEAEKNKEKIVKKIQENKEKNCQSFCTLFRARAVFL